MAAHSNLMDINGSSSSGSNNLYAKKKRYNNCKKDEDIFLAPELSPNVVTTDLSADHHQYFSETRSTPIIFTAASDSSSSDSIPQTTATAIKMKYNYDNRSLCSLHSGNHVISSDNSSTRNQVYYFGTPLLPQQHQPYQYHGALINTPATTIPPSSHGGGEQQKTKNKRNIFARKWQDSNNLQTSGASIKSSFSTGRQTIKSWRQRRINILLKKQQHLPDVETDAFCDVCEKYITTRIRYRNGAMVWLVSFILLLCTVILFWVPFYVKYFKDVAHYCTGCGKKIGVSYRL